MPTVPLSGTNVRLLTGIPFANDYKHTRWFDSLSEQTTWFTGKSSVYSYSKMDFQRIEGYRFLAVPQSVDQLWGVNYIMFQNADYNNKWFFGFVTKLEYKQRNTTYVHFEIDVLQTWMFDMNMKPSFVVREHCPLWNSDGSPVINTIDEGLNYGTEYDNVVVTELIPTGFKWMVILAKQPMHSGVDNSKVLPTVIGTPQPLTTYILPFTDDDTVPPVIDTTGAGIVISKPTQVLTALYSITEAQNNIVSIYVTDYTGIASNTSGGTVTMTNSNDVEGVQISDGTNFFNCLYVKKVLNFFPFETTIGQKYGGYKTVTESKLLMHPYTQLVLDDFKGNRVTFKNEYINNSNLKVLAKGSLGVSNKTSYGIQDYNYNASTYQSVISDETALINNDPNDIPIITDQLAAYLQGHKNSMNNQRAQIEWHGGNGLFSGLLNSVASLTTGNIGGAISNLSGVVSGTGNTYNQLQGINAKLQDINNQPPSIQKMGSNASYTIGNNFNGVFLIQKQIKDEYITKLTDFFGMFGYKKNEIKVPNFHTRQNWNYVETKSCNITGNFNDEDLKDLKAIFDSGITLWHTDDVGNYDLTNGVI